MRGSVLLPNLALRRRVVHLGIPHEWCFLGELCVLLRDLCV